MTDCVVGHMTGTAHISHTSSDTATRWCFSSDGLSKASFCACGFARTSDRVGGAGLGFQQTRTTETTEQPQRANNKKKQTSRGVERKQRVG